MTTPFNTQFGTCLKSDCEHFGEVYDNVPAGLSLQVALSTIFGEPFDLGLAHLCYDIPIRCDCGVVLFTNDDEDVVNDMIERYTEEEDE